jgi:hypothetical protein
MSRDIQDLRQVSLKVLFLAAAGLLGTGAAQAANPCNAPVPPPSCEGDPNPPPPKPPLQRPSINAFGDDEFHRVHIGVKAQAADATNGVTRYSVQVAPGAAGPWFTTHANLPYSWASGLGANVAMYNYTAPAPMICVRARVSRSTTDHSPWSVTKCAAQSPIPSSIQVKINNNGTITLRWFDHAALDVLYAVKYRPSWSVTYSPYIVNGTYGTTGNREVTFPVLSPWTSTCVVMWPLEIPPGYIGGHASTDYSDSTPMAPHHWQSPEVGGGYDV